MRENFAAYPESRQVQSSVSSSSDLIYYQTALTKGKLIPGSPALCHRFYEVPWSGRSPVTGVGSVSNTTTRDLLLALRFRAMALTSYQKQIGKDLEGLPYPAPAAVIYCNSLQRLNQQGSFWVYPLLKRRHQCFQKDV